MHVSMVTLYFWCGHFLLWCVSPCVPSSKLATWSIPLLLIVTYLNLQILTDRFDPTSGGSTPCSDLSTYCGGTFRGIINRLDYIQGLGVNAIWISPIPVNTPNGYHGYWAMDITKLNPHFGTESDLLQLVQECHKRGIWVMLDMWVTPASQSTLKWQSRVAALSRMGWAYPYIGVLLLKALVQRLLMPYTNSKDGIVMNSWNWFVKQNWSPSIESWSGRRLWALCRLCNCATIYK